MKKKEFTTMILSLVGGLMLAIGICRLWIAQYREEKS